MNSTFRTALLAGLAAMLALMVLVAPSPTPARAGGPFIFAAVKIIRGMVHRARTYESLERARDEEIKALQQQMAISQQHYRMLRSSPDPIVQQRAEEYWAQEQRRIKNTEQSFRALTERLKQITRKDFNKFLGRTVLETALQQLVGTLKAGEFVQRASSTVNDVNRVLDTLAAVGIGDLGALREQVGRLAGFLDVLSGAEASALRERLSSLRANLSELEGRAGELPEAIVRERLLGVRSDLRDVGSRIQGDLAAFKDWVAQGYGANFDKIARDETARQLSVEAKNGRDGRNVAALMEALALKGRARVENLARRGGVELTGQEFSEVFQIGSREILNNLKGGIRLAPHELDAIWLRAINALLESNGREPIPFDVAVLNFAGTFVSPETCPNPAAPNRWRVTIEQEPGSPWLYGSVEFHRCPGGGRSTYDFWGVATEAETVVLHGIRLSGVGPYEGWAPERTDVTFGEGMLGPNPAGASN